MTDTPNKLIFFILCVLLLVNSILYIILQPDLNNPNEINEGVDDNKNLTDEENLLIASKSILKFTINIFSGVFIDYVGYDISIFIGVFIIFGSTTTFSLSKSTFGQPYIFLLVIQCLQGFCSAFADTGSLALIANQCRENKSRLNAFGCLLIIISFGRLIAEPLHEFLSGYINERDSFFLIAFTGLLMAIFLLFVKRLNFSKRQQVQVKSKTKVTAIWTLLADPYIIVCAGALFTSNISLAFLEPTIFTWFEDSNSTYYKTSYNNESIELDMMWLPGFVATLFGVFLSVWFCRLYTRQVYIMASIGLFLQGLFCFILPFSKDFAILVIFGIFFGKAILDTSLLPLLSLIVDTKYTSFYGTIYSIANISYSIAYIIGPFLAVRITHAFSFDVLTKIISSITLLYVPVMYFIRSFYQINSNGNSQQTSLLYDNLTPATSSLDMNQYRIYKKKRNMKEVLTYI